MGKLETTQEDLTVEPGTEEMMKLDNHKEGGGSPLIKNASITVCFFLSLAMNHKPVLFL